MLIIFPFFCWPVFSSLPLEDDERACTAVLRTSTGSTRVVPVNKYVVRWKENRLETASVRSNSKIIAINYVVYVVVVVLAVAVGAQQGFKQLIDIVSSLQ